MIFSSEGMDRTELVSLLKQNEAFADAPDDTVAKLIEAGEIRDLEPGTVIISEGKQGESIWALLEGEFDVFVDGDLVNRMTKRGEVAGEISAVSLTAATATVCSSGDSRALCIPQQELHKVMDENPALAAAILRSMAKYLGRR